MKKTVAILVMTISACLAFAGSSHAQQKTMSIGTGGTGGVYYPLGGAICLHPGLQLVHGLARQRFADATVHAPLGERL